MGGAGYYAMAKDQLERFRAAVDDDAHRRRGRSASPPRSSNDGLRGRRIDELKSAPRGYPKDHPRVELLRRKGLMASQAVPGAPAWMHTKQAVAKVRDTWAGGEPLCAWLDANVGPSTLPPPDFDR